MNITECVPLAGRGLVARRGHLVALTDGMDAGPDPLLTALTAVADANGDGAALVLAGCWPPFFLSVKSAPGVVAG